MKHSILLLLLIISFQKTVTAQYCTGDNRFTDTTVFTDAQIISESGIVYGNALNYLGQNQDLIFNIHYPDTTVDTFAKRPLILLMHGGSFLGGTLMGLDKDCKEFAKRGFVAVTIEYRLGWGAAANCQGDTTSLMLAFYRGLQDEHAAFRYLAANASTYKIDTAWMFAGGNSAGSFASVNLAYATQQQMNVLYPFLQLTLGNLDTSGNTLTNTFKLKGLFHNWGSIADIDWIDSSNAIPMASFAGDQDIISHIDSGNYQNCTNYAFMWGARAIYNKLVSLGVCAELTVQVGGGHGVYNDTPEQDLYRTKRAVCFFKSLFCNACSQQYFTDSIAADCASLTSGIENYALQIAAIFYPNPATQNFTIELPGQHFELSLVDITGRKIFENKNLYDKAMIDVRDFQRGIYFIKVIIQDKAVLKKKLILVHD